MLIGYARTSTVEQVAGLEAQQVALAATGCTKLFSEQASSVAQRDQLAAALDFVREGDTLVVTRLDRLARSTADLLGIVAPVLHPPSLLSPSPVPSHRPPPCPTAPPRPSSARHARSERSSAPPRETKCPTPASKCQNHREICEAKRHTADTRRPAPQSCGRRSRADAFAKQPAARPAPRPARTPCAAVTSAPSSGLTRLATRGRSPAASRLSLSCSTAILVSAMRELGSGDGQMT